MVSDLQRLIIQPPSCYARAAFLTARRLPVIGIGHKDIPIAARILALRQNR